MDPSAGPAQRFASELRGLRREAGTPTYRAMARKAGYSAVTLSTAAQGDRLPTLPVTLAYVAACGCGQEESRAWEERWNAAADEAREAAARAHGTGEEPPPYRGLARFDTVDSDLFFGREQLSDDLAALVRAHRCTAVVGPSGSGKSSLLRAGLVPRLRQGRDDSAEPAPGLAVVRVLTPGGRPPREWREALTPAAAEGETCVIVDQFEETFTLCPDAAEREAFTEAVLAARRPGSRLRVVLGIRADFYGRCLHHPGLAAVLREAALPVPPMSAGELRRAVTGPAAARGLLVERALTERLVTEVAGEPGALPLMSHALLETWRRRESRTLTLSAYEAAGGLHGAIAQTAEDLYSTFSAEQAAPARRLLLRLVTPGEGTPDTRRPAARAELEATGPGTGQVLEALARARLLTLDDDTADLAHEALLTAWPRLREWIDAERDRLRTHRRLTEAARAWRELGHDGGALYRGLRLAEAEEAFGDGVGLTPDERRFLAASSRQRRRAARVRNAVTAVLVTLALVATAAAVTAYRQRATARAERDAAVFHQVTTEADRLRGTQSSLAAQLDLVARRLRATPDLRTRLATDANTSLSVPLAGRTSAVEAVHFAPDGRTLAGVGEDGILRVWRLSGSSPATAAGGPLTGRTEPVETAAFAPDGRVLATTGTDGVIRLWDVTRPARPRPLGRPLTGHTNLVSDIVFSPDGRTLATSGQDGTVRLWDLADPARARGTGMLRTRGPGATAIGFGPDGRVLALAEVGGSVLLRDVTRPRHPRTLGRLANSPNGAVTALAFSPDGRTLATSESSVVKLWGVGDPGHPASAGQTLPGEAETLTFSADGRTLAGGGADGGVRVWDVTNPWQASLVEPPLTDHTKAVTAVAFGPDGTLASGGGDHTVRLWRRPSTVLTSPGGAASVALAPDGRTLASAGFHLRLWDVTDPHHPRPLSERPDLDTMGPNHVAFSPDGRTLALGGADRTLRLWDVTAPARPVPLGAPLHGHRAPVTSVAFSPDGTTLASTSQDRTIRLWDVTDPSAPAALGPPLTGHDGAVWSAAFSPDGHTLVSVGDDDAARRWDVTDPARPAPAGPPLATPGETPAAVAFGPDGRTLATGGAGGTVHLWNLTGPRDPRPRHRLLTGHTSSVLGLALSPDGRMLAGTGNDTTVRLWDLTDPAHPAPFGAPLAGHTRAATSAAFSPDGHTLVTGSEDPSVILWDLEPGHAEARVCGAAPDVLGEKEWEQYIPQLRFTPPCGTVPAPAAAGWSAVGR